jgi:hypothetical protein
MNKVVFAALFLLFSFAALVIAGAASALATFSLSSLAAPTQTPVSTPYSTANAQRDIWIEIGLSFVILGVIAVSSLIIKEKPNAAGQK